MNVTAVVAALPSPPPLVMGHRPTLAKRHRLRALMEKERGAEVVAKSLATHDGIVVRIEDNLRRTLGWSRASAREFLRLLKEAGHIEAGWFGVRSRDDVAPAHVIDRHIFAWIGEDSARAIIWRAAYDLEGPDSAYRFTRLPDVRRRFLELKASGAIRYEPGKGWRRTNG